MNARGRATARWPARGFSLVELAVVLVIIGAMGALLWRGLPQWRPVADGDPVGRDLILAEQALQGFVLSAHRLPCPDSSSAADGIEHCADGTSIGRLPVRTLGLPATLGNLRYGVHRGAGDLTVASNRHLPLLPPGSASVVVNGLDFCVALQQAQGAGPGVDFAVGGQAVAFALAHPGSEDRDGDGALFDGANKGTTFAMPGTPASATYDDRVAAVGLGELAVRLGCMQRLGIANGGARASYAAYDEDRFAAMYVEFRVLALSVAQSNTKAAEAAQAQAIADMVIAVATSTSAIALAAVTSGVGASTIGPAAIAVALAVTTLTLAVLGLQGAYDDEATAHDQLDAANAFKARTALLLVQARERAIELDTAGLQP